MNLIAFVILTGLAVSSALVVVWRTNPVESALALAFNLVSLAGFYLFLGAQFISFLQVIVYAGAIMVLILFVIMVLNLPDRIHRGSGFLQRWLGPGLAGAFTVLMGLALSRDEANAAFEPASADFGTVSSVGTMLYSDFFYAFEAISLLLVVAMVGAVLLAKKRI